MKVAIVGAGISGLALAGGLEKRGHEVTIFEKGEEIRAGGSGITLAPNALTALDYLGLGSPFRKLQQSQKDLTGGQKSPSGTWIARIPSSVTSKSLVIDRYELHELLFSQLRKTSVVTGTEVEVSDLEALPCDLIVGADGINSQVRKALGVSVKPRYAGYSVWRGITPEPFDVGCTGIETWGAKARFGIAPLHDGRVYWFGVRSTMDSALLEETFSRWHEPIPSLIDATPSEEVQFLPIRELDSDLPSFINGRVVLVGDAAHAMTPNLGQGACQALEDVAVLCKVLEEHTDVHKALAEYDALRRPRAQKIARQSRFVGKALHFGGPLTAKLRNALIRAVPNSSIERQALSISQWEV